MNNGRSENSLKKHAVTTTIFAKKNMNSSLISVLSLKYCCVEHKIHHGRKGKNNLHYISTSRKCSYPTHNISAHQQVAVHVILRAFFFPTKQMKLHLVLHGQTVAYSCLQVNRRRQHGATQDNCTSMQSRKGTVDFGGKLQCVRTAVDDHQFECIIYPWQMSKSVLAQVTKLGSSAHDYSCSVILQESCAWGFHQKLIFFFWQTH